MPEEVAVESQEKTAKEAELECEGVQDRKHVKKSNIAVKESNIACEGVQPWAEHNRSTQTEEAIPTNQTVGVGGLVETVGHRVSQPQRHCQGKSEEGKDVCADWP
jgi:hypothetical protein